MGNNAAIAAMQLMASDTDRATSLLRRLAKASHIDGTINLWLAVIAKIPQDGHLHSGTERASPDAERLLIEWRCFVRSFERFLTRMGAVNHGAVVDPGVGTHAFDYTYALSLLRRLSRMTLDALGLSRELTDACLDDLSSCIVRREAT